MTTISSCGQRLRASARKRFDLVEHVASDQQRIARTGLQLPDQPVQEGGVFGMAIKAVESLAEVPIGSVDQAHGVSIITSKRCMLDARGGSRLCSMPDQNPISRDWLSAVMNVLTPSPGAFVVLLAKSWVPACAGTTSRRSSRSRLE